MSTMPAVRENLTRAEAEARAKRIGEVSTAVELDLTTDTHTFESSSTLRFEVLEPGTTFVDLTARTVHTALLDGEPLPAEAIAATRISLGHLGVGDHELVVKATMRYQHEGNGLHRFVDPTDNRVYLHSQFEPFDAHLVYACFDQPDLKTRFSLTVDAPEEWVVVSNNPATAQPPNASAGRWTFAPTDPISTYITAVVAGSYVSVHDRYERADASGINLGLYVRRSLAEHLDADEVFEVTKQSFAAMEQLFDQRYPFGDKYDQLFVPEFSAGAMENPGCVTFTEQYIFRSQVTDAVRERRAETIIHEMAHMWFGDLVTMRWWDDLWLNESFATFMSVLVQATATRWKNAWVTFLDAEKSWAKYQDQLPSTHPIADEMPDVESVHQNFDGITYAKGASVLRQLVAWVGQDAFIAGCREYFAKHAWKNTTLDDFLGALERASGRDLAGWRDEWLLTTGLNTLAVEATVGDDGAYQDLAVVQTSPRPTWAGLASTPNPREILRRHRVTVGVYQRNEDGLVRTAHAEFDVTGARTEVTELIGTSAGDVILVNDDDLTYAKAEIDDVSAAALRDQLREFVAPLPRALVWSNSWDMVRDGRLAARSFVALVTNNAAAEPNVGVLQRLLQRASAAATRYAAETARTALTIKLARHARTVLPELESGSDLQLAWVRHWAGVAVTDPDQRADVAALLDGTQLFEGVQVDTDLRWHLLTTLARVGERGDADIDAELASDDTDIGQRHAATARASQPSAAAKEAVWDQLLTDTDLSHTMSRQLWHGFAQLDQSEILAPYTDKYFAALDEVWRERSLDWALSFSAAMFPHAAVSDALLARVDDELARDDLPKPLRRVLLEERDTLVRTLTARAYDAASDVPV